MELEQLRAKINEIDDRLLDLLNDRARIAMQIGEIKKKMEANIIDREREEQIYQRILKKNQGPFSGEAIKSIFALIIQKSRELQKNMREDKW